MSVFFNLERVYDTTWRYGIINDLIKPGLESRTSVFINNFLQDRRFRVRMDDIFSEGKDQERGVPQGSILSVTFFNIKINDIIKDINNRIDCALHVNDSS